MDRYDDLDLDLECEEGNVSQKAAIFGGMFKKSIKSSEPTVQPQDNLSSSTELSRSSDSLTDGGSKDKGVFKGMFKKTTKAAKEDQPQAALSVQNAELSASSEHLESKSSKDKSAGKSKRSPRLGHIRRASQDLLDLSFSHDDGSENNKESGGVFSGMFKKSPKLSAAQAQSQEDLSAPSELSGSADNLNAKESGGVFSGLFKKPPKRLGVRTQSQDDLSADGELSGSSDGLAVNSNAKESGGMFSGMFKKGHKHRTQSQEDLSADGKLSGSSENLDENPSKEKGGLFSGVFRKKAARSQSQDDLSMDAEPSAEGKGHTEKPSKEKSENSEDATAEKPKTKQFGFTAMMKSTFHTDKKEKSPNSDEEASDSEDNQTGPKQNKLAGAMTKLNPFRGVHKHEKQMSSDEEDPAASEKPSAHKQSAVAGAMSKLNPFRSANKKETEDGESLKDSEQQVKEKPKPVKSNTSQPENPDRRGASWVPPRPAEKEMKRTSADDRDKSRRPQYDKESKDVIPRQRQESPEETPEIPARPSEQEMSRTRTRDLQKQRTRHQNQSGDEGTEGDESAAAAENGEEMNIPENTAKKHKKPNPFMPRSADKAASDDEGLKDEDESSSKEEKKEEEGQEKTPKPKVKKYKKHNPFMPRVKGKVMQRTKHGAAGNEESEGANRSLFDQLEEYRDPGNPETPQDTQDAEDLMDWWNTVEPWEDRPEDEDLTEKEEAKAFAVTADKVQKGIRVFNKLFSERAESLWQHVIDLNAIADGLDKFNKNTKIAQITGGSTSAIGGVATITGLALAPVTMGTSLIVTAVGLGIATAGGLTSAGAGISNQVNNSMDRKKVEKIVEDYQEKIADLNKCLKFIKQGIENLRRFDLMKMKNHAYNQDFPALTSSFYEDGAMAGKAILINANEIMRVVQIANVAGSTAARAVQIASMATGVLTGLFVGMDIYFVAKDSKILKKGAKSEFAAKIREVATQLHDGLVELNTIREELQSTTPEGRAEDAPAGNANQEEEKKEKDDHDHRDSSSEDEIDRIKKAIKKEYENREYV
ncbi:apolipoprotein L1 isoform X2 [Salarias fasciatus]|uniref:apolipoprotein L1 isoform X2 n=1 Tax=Salarias fasciatus TaxID=181472 RepID=UPI0011769F1F|nr:nucleolar protein dao-5-like isoform X2 [Salarias fasciatus]